MEKRYILNCLNFCNWAMCSSMSVIAPFFPTFAYSQGLSKIVVGSIFSLHPIGAFLSSIYIGRLLTNQNRFKFLSIACLFQSFCLLMFVLLYLIKGKFTIILISSISRFLNGICYGFMLTIVYSYIPILYPEDKSSKLALTEFISSMGYAASLFLGSLLYSIGGFTAPFIVYSLISIIAMLLIISAKKHESFENTGTLPKKDVELTDLKESVDQKSEQKLIGYYELFRTYEIWFYNLMNIYVTAIYTVTFPLLAQYLLDQFDKDANTAGFYMSVGQFGFGVGTVILIFLKNPDCKKILLIALLLIAFSQIFQGPDKLLTGLDRNLTIFCFAQFFSSLGCAFVCVCSLIEMNEFIVSKYPEQENHCRFMVTAIYSASLSLGDFLGPLMAGILGQYFEYDRVASILGVTILISCLGFIKVFRN